MNGSPKPVSAEAQEAAEQVVCAQAALNRLTLVAQERVIALALAVAERVVGESVALCPELLSRIYSRAIASAGPFDSPGIMEIHSEDRPCSSVDSLAKRSGLVIVEDDSVGRGGVRIRCGGAVLDASLVGLLERLELVLLGDAPGVDTP
jgi:flagellar biosynthesis/type III secretory pathway protein FliH